MAGVLEIFLNLLEILNILQSTQYLRRRQLWIDLQNRLQAALTSSKRPQARYQAAQEATSSADSRSIGYWTSGLGPVDFGPCQFLPCQVSFCSSKESSHVISNWFFVLKHLEFSDYVFANT